MYGYLKTKIRYIKIGPRNRYHIVTETIMVIYGFSFIVVPSATLTITNIALRSVWEIQTSCNCLTVYSLECKIRHIKLVNRSYFCREFIEIHKLIRVINWTLILKYDIQIVVLMWNIRNSTPVKISFTQREIILKIFNMNVFLIYVKI